ncbi:MAG: hypothetical protein AB1489_13000, partial [Acidobacteriota bacterium]
PGVKLEEIKLNKNEVNRIAAFLRVINAIENIRSSVSLGLRAKQLAKAEDIQTLIKLALSETSDAIDVLSNGALKKEKSIAQPLNSLNQAKMLLTNASNSADVAMKLALIDQAIVQYRMARTGLADPATLPMTFQN